MKPRVAPLPLQTLDDFFNLAELLSEEEKKTLLNDYTEILITLIKSPEDALLFVKKSKKLIATYSLFDNHPNLFANAFHSADAFITFCKNEKNDYNFQVRRLIGRNELTKIISNLFVYPEDVIRLLKLNPDIAIDLFRDNLPCAQQLVHNREQFSILKYHEGTYSSKGKMALCAVMHIADSLTDDKKPNLEILFDFAYAFSDMPRDYDNNTARSYYYSRPNSNHSVNVEEYLLKHFKNFLYSSNHTELFSALTKRESFLAFFKHSDVLGLEILNKVDIVEVLFPVGMTLEGLKIIAKDYPMLAKHLFKKSPEQVSALFQSIAQYRDFYEYCKQHTKVVPTHIPTDNVVQFFSSSDTSDISDWMWLARNSEQNYTEAPYHNHYTALANGVLVKCSANMQTVFSNPHNFSQVTSASPVFVDEVIRNLSKEKFEPKTVFANAEDFWQFLQAGGTQLVYFSKSVLKKYPQHIAYIHAKTNQFRTLDKEFLKELFAHDPYRQDWGIAYDIINNISKTLQENGGIAVTLNISPLSLGWCDSKTPEYILSFAKSREDLLAVLEIFNVSAMKNHPTILENPKYVKYIASEKCQIPELLNTFKCNDILNQLGKINPELLTALIQHHSEKMLPLLGDIQIFLQLKFDHCSEFFKQQPAFFARVMALVSFKDILEFFKRNSWEIARNQDNVKNLDELFVRAAATIAKAFVSASAETQARGVKKHFSYVQILLTHAPTVMAPAFSGAAFVRLMEINAAIARELLNKNKDHLGAIISSTDDVDAINKQNPMLLALFKQQFPQELEAHLKTLVKVNPSSAKTNRWCAFYPTRQQQPEEHRSTTTNSEPFHLSWII